MFYISNTMRLINAGGKFNDYLFNTLRSIKIFKIKGHIRYFLSLEFVPLIIVF